MAKTVLKAQISRFGNGEVTLKAEPHMVKWLSELKGMDLTVEFKPWKSNRSLNQNALFWKIVGLCDEAENGRESEAGAMAIYANLITMAGVSKVIYQTTPEALAETERRKLFRYIEILETDNTPLITWRGYYGSSTFDTAEMNLLIETAKDYATQLGILMEG